jgi:hypothetical protein
MIEALLKNIVSKERYKEMYEKKILNALLDKYENSKSFIGDNKVKQKFTIVIPNIFSKYDDDSEYETFVQINESISKLVELTFIEAKVHKNGVYSKVVMNMDKLTRIYEYVERIPKTDINKELEILLGEYTNHNCDVLASFAAEQLERLKTNKGIKYYDGNIVNFKNLLYAIEVAYKNQNEIYIRDFSIRLFKDSKKFETIVDKFKNLLFEYGDFSEKDIILDELNIIKTPTYVSIKGAAKIYLQEQVLDLSAIKGDIAFSTNSLKEISRVEIYGCKVITVENLTSFHTIEDADALIIYLGGFHNTIRRKFIELIYKDNPNMKYLHFGDIDAGGFLIYEHLREKTGVQFERYHMDIPTLEKHKPYWRKLTLNDKKRLSKFKNKEYYDVIEYMLGCNCKLEQEIVT